MKLYEIAPAYHALRDAAEDGEDVATALATIEDELERKVESIAHIDRGLDAEAEAIRAEEQRLAKRRRALESNRERLREYVRVQMIEHGVQKVKTPTTSFAIVEGPPRVEVENEAAVPDFYTRTRREVDKAAILAAHKDDGEIVPGTRVVRDWQLRIR